MGEFDDTVQEKSFSLSKKPRLETARKKKTRPLSPPRKFNGFKPNSVEQGTDAKYENGAALASSPPLLPVAADDDDDDYGPSIAMEDIDTLMSDAPIPPSSPTAKAIERKKPLPEDEEEEDDLAVAQVQGHSGIRDRKVNISASRPVKAAPLPNPGASSPMRAQEIDSSAWISVTQGLNVMPMPETTSMGKLAPQDAVEEDGSIKMFWMDYTEVNGALMLFGKVMDKRTKKYVSAFLKVDGMMRNLFFLPREHRMRGFTR